MSEVLRTLIKGRERIAKGWCVSNFGQTAVGIPCDPNGKEAVRWCARGAVGSSFIDGKINEAAEEALARALPVEYLTFGRQPTGNDVAAFNNRSSQAEVLALFDRAIAMERAKTQRTDSELFAELMARISTQMIASPEYVRA